MQIPDDYTPPRNEPYNLERFRVLVIEDATFISDLLCSCMTEMGVGSVVRAFDLEDAKDKILSNNAIACPTNIDMVLLDWLLPGGTGGDLLKWMRKHKGPLIRFLPVVVCSAYTSTKLVFESRDSGANEVMVKPVSAEKIAKRMLHIIDNPRPYVQSPTFIGPDRRRQTLDYHGDDRRKIEPEVISEK